MSNQVITVLKALLVVIWIWAAGSFLAGDATIFQMGRLVFMATLAAHVVECFVFRAALRASGKPLAGQVVQMLLFGIVHYASLRQEAAEEPRS